MTPERLGDVPSRMPPADLAGAFGGPDRSEGLAGRLAPLTVVPEPPPPSSPAAAPTQPNPEATPADPSPGRTGAGKAPTARPRSVERAPAGGGVQPVIVYLPASLRDRLRAAVGDRSYTAIVLEAIDATHGHLAARFGTERPGTGSLFAGRGQPKRQRHTEPQVQVSLRPLRDDLAIIDRLVADTGAPSRSALVAAALQEHLLG